MSDTNFEVGLQVSTTSDDAKLADVVAELQKINQQLASNASASQAAGEAEKAAHDEAIGAAKEHGDALTDLAKKVAGLVAGYAGLRAAWESFKEGTQEFMLQERALGQLSNIVKQFGQDGKEAAEQTEALARRLAGVGLNENEVIQGAQRMTFVTGDYKQALSAASLAADASVKTGNNYAETLNIIQMLMMDNKRGVLMAHRQLGIEATTCAGALAEIDARARGAAEQLKDTTAAAAGFSTIIKERWKDMGGLVASIWAPMARFAADYEKKQEEATIELEYDFKKMIGATDDADKWYADAIKKWKEKFGIPLGEEMAKLTTMGDKSLTSPEALDALGKATKESMTKLQHDVDQAVAEQKKEDDEAQRKAEEAQIRANENADVAAQDQKRIDQVQLTMEENSRARRLAAIRKEAQDAAHLKEQVEKELNVNLAKMDNERITEYMARLKKELLNQKLTADEKQAIEQKLAAAEKQIDANVAAAKSQTAVDALQTMSQAAVTAFQGNKAVAIADATISTLVSAGNAAETQPFFPMGLAMMALAIAQGVARVKAIESTGPGSSGGVAAGGGSAAVYGGTSISTPVPTIQNSSVQNSTNVQGGDTYNVSAITGNDAVTTMMQLQKKLRPGSRAYDRQIASRQPVKIGTVRGG